MQGSEREMHDYLPGDEHGQMYTDPLCRICGHGYDYYLHANGEK